MTLVFYLAVLMALIVWAPDRLVRPGEGLTALWLLGTIGAWRYSWWGVHLVRSAWYRGVVFPSWRRALTRSSDTDDGGVDPAHLPSELFVIITSYRIPPETAALAFRSAIVEAIGYPRPATIVAAVVEFADERMVRAQFRRLTPPERVRLLVVRTPGTGKRDALATALRAVARQRPQPGAAVVVQDGDCVLPGDGLVRALPFLVLMPGVGGITTDEDCVLRTGGPALLAWHRLRFAQRHLLMGSHGLSRRLLTMTGRMSAFPAEVATHPGFIDIVRNDALDHWRLGRFRLLTGEDKSTAYWLLRHGLRMIYVPDVKVLTVEDPPGGTLHPAATKLMLRWFGNMLRASGRAARLGPSRLGLFTWWCFVDQQISVWTPLIGPFTALFAALAGRPEFLWAYVVWVMGTRLLQALFLLSARPTMSGLWPILIYYNQLWGALVKTWILFRLDRQRWTRQNIVLPRGVGPWRRRFIELGSSYLHALALLALATAAAFWTGFLAAPYGGLPGLAP